MSLRLQPVDLLTDGWTPTTKQSDNIENGGTNLEKVLVTPLSTLTTAALDGTGAFDVLMRATKVHLKEEYDKHRITGKEYSTVYLGALVTVLQTATQFLMNEQQVHKINAEIGLIRQKTVTELAITDDNIPIGLGFNHIPNVVTAIPPVTCYPIDVPISTCAAAPLMLVPPSAVGGPYGVAVVVTLTFDKDIVVDGVDPAGAFRLYSDDPSGGYLDRAMTFVSASGPTLNFTVDSNNWIGLSDEVFVEYTTNTGTVINGASGAAVAAFDTQIGNTIYFP